MRVAYLSLAPFISGAERSLQLLILNCQKKGLKPILISPPNSPMHNWAKKNQIRSYRCDLGIFTLSRFFVWAVSQVKLLYILLVNRVEIVHSNQIWSLPAAQLPSKILRIKRVCHFRDPIDISLNWWLKGGLDFAFAISKQVASEIDTNIAPDLIEARHTIINPINLDTKCRPDNLSEIKLAARYALNLPGNVKIFGYIGQVRPVKGVIQTISAFAAIPEETRSLLLIAGEDTTEKKEYLTECKQLATKLGIVKRVIFLGFIEEVSNFYNSVDVVIVHSYEEPLGRVPLEAGSYYTPTIATNVGGLPETIMHNETGWLVDPNNINETISAMKFCVGNDISNYGLAARQYVMEISDPSVYADKVIDIYKKLSQSTR
jgi:glycosyltransferase involved in cell wall biosynthesis